MLDVCRTLFYNLKNSKYETFFHFNSIVRMTQILSTANAKYLHFPGVQKYWKYVQTSFYPSRIFKVSE